MFSVGMKFEPSCLEPLFLHSEIKDTFFVQKTAGQADFEVKNIFCEQARLDYSNSLRFSTIWFEMKYPNKSLYFTSPSTYI